MRFAQAGARVSALRITVAFVSVALLATGCHVPGTSAASAGPAGSQTVTVAVVGDPGSAPLSVGDAPLRLAARDGVFRQHGLKVVIKSYPALSGAIGALRSGAAQIASGDYTGFLYQQYTGALNLRLIADGFDGAPNMMEILTKPGSGIITPQDLDNKLVATPESVVSYPPGGATDSAGLPYNIETLAAQTVLENDGASPTTVKWTSMPAADMIGALSKGTVSAILAPEPYVFEAESQLGAQEVLDSCSGATAGLPLSGYFSLAAYARAHVAAVDDFRAALLQAQADASMRGPLQAVLPSATGMTAQDAALVTLGTYPTSVSIGQVQRVAQLMFDTEMIGNTLNVKRLVSG